VGNTGGKGTSTGLGKQADGPDGRRGRGRGSAAVSTAVGRGSRGGRSPRGGGAAKPAPARSPGKLSPPSPADKTGKAVSKASGREAKAAEGHGRTPHGAPIMARVKQQKAVSGRKRVTATKQELTPLQRAEAKQRTTVTGAKGTGWMILS